MATLSTVLRKALQQAIARSPQYRRVTALHARVARLQRELRQLRARVDASPRARPDTRDKGAVPSAADIRSFRAAAGLTRAALAQRLGVSQSIVFLWESGRSVPRRRRTLIALQRVMNRRAGRRSSPPGRRGERTFTSAEVRAVRKKLGLSRKAFADRVGVSANMVYLWESGRSTPRRDNVVRRLRQLR